MAMALRRIPRLLDSDLCWRVSVPSTDMIIPQGGFSGRRGCVRSLDKGVRPFLKEILASLGVCRLEEAMRLETRPHSSCGRSRDMRVGLGWCLRGRMTYCSRGRVTQASCPRFQGRTWLERCGWGWATTGVIERKGIKFCRED